MNSFNQQIKSITAILFVVLFFSACKQTQQTVQCEMPSSNNLSAAIGEANAQLPGPCTDQFDSVFQRLLSVAEQDPKPENRALFSEFLMGSSEQGVITKAHAKQLYNRYFNIKFMALTGDFNNCSSSCPIKQQIVSNMQQELLDKELGLLKISRDKRAYQRANRLIQETELVLAATCHACNATY